MIFEIWSFARQRGCSVLVGAAEPRAVGQPSSAGSGDLCCGAMEPQTAGRWDEEGQMQFSIDTEQEDDGRWIVEVRELPGVLTYGASREAAIAHAQALALRVIAERLEHGEEAPMFLSITFAAATL